MFGRGCVGPFPRRPPAGLGTREPNEHRSAGRIPNGALIERELQTNLDGLGALTFKLRNPDFRTAIRITDAINTER